MQEKLSGWKKQCLSLVGRMMLVKAVSSPIAMFVMQHSQLPFGVCKEIERLHREFIWGSSQGKRRVHAVSWDVLCLPKEQGSIGLMSLEDMNRALLGKLTWNLFAKPDSLCSKVLIGKYGRKVDLYKECIVKKQDLDLWKSLAGFLEVVVGKIAWECRDGKTANFWKDNWLVDDACLFDKAVKEPEGLLVECNVRDMVNKRGNRADFLERFLDETYILRLRAAP